jgi:hypothetical protein
MIKANKFGIRAANRLVKVSEELKDILPSASSISLNYNFSDIPEFVGKELTTSINEAIGKSCLLIYSFHLNSAANHKDFKSAFSNAKDNKLGNLAYPRLNKAVGENWVDCIYVGTSRKTSKRLTEHLGYGDDRTYSLHLAKWATLLLGGIEIRIHPFKLQPELLHLLPYLEDALADELKPLLGRRGNL